MANKKKFTRKEQAYIEYLHLQNRINELLGKEERLRDDDEYINSDAFKYAVKCAKPTEMLISINEGYHREIKRLIEKKERDKFFATEDGTKYKAFFEERLENVNDEIATEYKQANDELSAIIKGLLGDDWGVNFTPAVTDIGIIESGDRFIFGHSFTIFHSNTYLFSTDNEEKYTIDKMRFDFSCGSMMSFSIFEEKSRRDFEIGKGKFLDSTETLLKVRQVIYDRMIRVKSLEEDANNLRARLEKPDMEYYNALVSLAELKKKLSED